MKVVIAGYNTCCFNKSGGVQVRIKKIYELLSKENNIEVEYFCPMTTDITTCDIIHIFKLEPEFYNLVRKAKSIGIKIVLSSIITTESSYKYKLYHYVLNRLPVMSTYKMIESILQNVDAVIVETKKESQFLIDNLKIQKSKVHIIGNGIDLNDYCGNEIFDKLGGRRDYVLQVGAIDRNKNQINTIRALAGTNLDLVLIGGPSDEKEGYIEKCRAEAIKYNVNVHFLGWIDNGSPLLSSAYYNASVFVCPSFHETFGFVILEAAIAKCNIAMSSTLPILDYGIFEGCELFDPNNPIDMRKKIIKASKKNKTNSLRELTTSLFSWDAIIEKHIQLYYSLL